MSERIEYMTAEKEKIMFEMYRQTDGDRAYRVVYFTELDEHNKDKEINDAMNGDFFFDGYILAANVKESKSVITKALEKLNRGEAVTPEDVKSELLPYLI